MSERSSQSTVRYSCPQCRVELTASAEDAGQRKECPSCGKAVKVPGTSSATTSSGTTSTGTSGSVATATARQLRIPCPHCRETLYATLDQVGQSLLCENCLESVPVVEPTTGPSSAGPRRAEPAAMSGAGSEQPAKVPPKTTPPGEVAPATTAPSGHDAGLTDSSRESTDDDELQLAADPELEADLPPAPEIPQSSAAPPHRHPSSRSEHRIEPSADLDDGDDLQLADPVDRALPAADLILGDDLDPLETPDGSSPSQAGDEPPATPSPWPEFSSPSERAPTRAKDSVGPTIGPTSDSPVANPTGQFGVPCPVCGTRVYATAGDIGKIKPCPDCFSDITIHAPRKTAKRSRDRTLTAPDAGDGDDFGLGAPEPAPVYESAQQVATTQAQDALKRAEEEYRQQEKEDGDEIDLSDVPWADLTFKFFADPQLIARLIVVSIGLFAWFSLVDFAIALYATKNAIATFGSMACWILACLLGAGTGIGLGTICGVIVTDTAAGNSKISGWPDLAIVDWAVECLYAVAACFVAAFPGFLLAQVVFFTALPSWLAVALMLFSIWCLFPIVYLSMAESGSMVMPYSPMVWKSLVEVSTAWWLFYGISAGLTLISGLAMLLLLPQWIVLNFPVAVVLVTVLMIYSRYLGFLAWTCADRMPGEDEDERPKRKKKKKRKQQTDDEEA